MKPGKIITTIIMKTFFHCVGSTKAKLLARYCPPYVQQFAT